MASYLLLRNNKESGPFNLNDLLKFGLKPYDLVWVEGKSAAWRYPSEIEELKAYSPAVEEQPYDRFFKKPSQAQSQETVIPVTTPVAEQVKEKPIVEDIIQQEKAIEEKYEKYIPKKSVFVTMPGQANKAAQHNNTTSTGNTQYNGHANGQSNSQQVNQHTLNSQYAQKPTPTPQSHSKYQPVPEPEPEPTPIITVTENPEAAKIKFSQPLDEIKEMYVKTLQERKYKISKKNFLLANLKRAAVIIGLVTLGILAGLAIKSESDNDTLGITNIPNSAPVTTAVPNSAANGPTTDPATEENMTTVTKPAVNSALIDNPEPLPPQVKQQIQDRQEIDAITPSRTKKDQSAVFTTDRQTRYEEPQAPLDRNPNTGERSKRTRTANDMVDTDNNRDKPVAKSVMSPRKSGLESLVSVSSNDYKRVAFGGIRNLELTVTNESKFVLDKVTVQLQYLKPSEEPLKTELIQFHSVSPNGSMTMRIKDTNRGIKVSYKIVDIQAQQTETALRE